MSHQCCGCCWCFYYYWSMIEPSPDEIAHTRIQKRLICLGKKKKFGFDFLRVLNWLTLCLGISRYDKPSQCRSGTEEQMISVRASHLMWPTITHYQLALPLGLHSLLVMLALHKVTVWSFTECLSRHKSILPMALWSCCCCSRSSKSSNNTSCCSSSSSSCCIGKLNSNRYLSINL